MNDETCGRVNLYHPSGALATLPLSRQHATAFQEISDALAAGWLVNAPGLEAGEEKQPVSHFLRRAKKNDDGSYTPVLDLYHPHPKMIHSLFTHYLNTQKDIAEFEKATGLVLNNMPKALGKIDKGKDKDADALLIATKRPVEVVLIPNPKYDAEEATTAKAAGKDYIIPSRKFVRWAEVVVAAKTTEKDEPLVVRPPQPDMNEEEKARQFIIKQAVSEWEKKFATCDYPADLNPMLPALKTLDETTKRAVWNRLLELAKNVDWQWDNGTKGFIVGANCEAF